MEVVRTFVRGVDDGFREAGRQTDRQTIKMSVREVCWYAGQVVDVIVDAVAGFF